MLAICEGRGWDNVRDTDNLEPVFGNGIDEVGTLHVDGLDGVCQWDGSCKEERYVAQVTLGQCQYILG